MTYNNLNLYKYYGPKNIVTNTYCVQLSDMLVLKIDGRSFKVNGWDIYNMEFFRTTWSYIL